MPAVAADDRRVVWLREACRLMGWRYGWAVRHWAEIGAWRDADRRVKVRMDRLAR